MNTLGVAIFHRDDTDHGNIFAVGWLFILAVYFLLFSGPRLLFEMKGDRWPAHTEFVRAVGSMRMTGGAKQRRANVGLTLVRNGLVFLDRGRQRQPLPRKLTDAVAEKSAHRISRNF